MGRKNKIRMPSSEGGIVRYFDDEYKSMIMLKPEFIIILTIAIAAFVLALNWILG